MKNLQERLSDGLLEKFTSLYFNRIFNLYGKREDLKLPYFRDYYIICLAMIQLVLDKSITVKKGMDDLDDLIQMKVNAEIEPDNPNDEFTLESIEELTSYITEMKPIFSVLFAVGINDLDTLLMNYVYSGFDNYENEDSEEPEIDDDVPSKLESLDQNNQPIEYVRIVAWNDYDEKTKLANDNVLEFIRRFSDFAGFDESAFLYENIGFAIVVEIDHANHSLLIYKGSDDIRMVERSFTGEIQIDLLADFMNKLD